MSRMLESNVRRVNSRGSNNGLRSVFFGEDHCNKCDDMAVGDEGRVDGSDATKPIKHNDSSSSDGISMIPSDIGRMGDDPRTWGPEPVEIIKEGEGERRRFRKLRK